MQRPFHLNFTKQIPNKNIITAIPKSKITQIICRHLTSHSGISNKKSQHNSKTYYVWLGQLVIFYHFLWLYYTIYSSIVKQFFILFLILILYFYYHQFFRYYQRIINAISYNTSRKFIIGLCCHKETLL